MFIPTFRAFGRKKKSSLASLSTLVQKLFGSTPTGRTVTDSANTGTTRPLQQGRCYDFDGTDDYVVANDLGATADWSWTAWVNLDTSTPAIQYLISGEATKGVFVEFGAGATADGWGVYDGSSFVFGNNLAESEWIHLAVTKSGTTYTVYENGVQTGTGTLVEMDLDDIEIGRRKDAAGPYNGQMFDCRVYNKVLTASELTHVVSFGRVGTDPTTTNLAAQYKMDEQAGTTSYDSSGNAKNGTITNATLSTFHATQTKYSFQNQVGYSGGLYFDGTGDAAYADSLGYDENTKQSYYVKFLADSNAIGYLWATRDGSNGGLSVFVDNSQNLTFVVGTTTAYIENSQAYDDGLFHELFTYYDGNDQLTVYVDGVEKTTDEPITTTSWNSAQPFILGARGNTLPAVSVDFEGVISEMRVWSGESSPQIPSEMDTSTTTRWYKLDENINDSGSDSRHLKLLGDPGWSFIPRNESNTANDITGAALDFTGKAPQDAALIDSTCADFDGTNDIAISNSVILSTTDGTQPYSFSMWINSTDTIAGIMTQYVAGSAKRFGLRINADKINYFKASNLVTSTTSINDGVWHHCVFTKASDGTVNCYVDGAFEATGSDTLAFDNDNFTLGMFVGSTAPNQYDGLMSDARIYDTELTAANVLYLFDSTKGTDPGTASLIAHWPIEEGYGTTFFDVSGNNYHCNLQNATLSTFWATVQDNNHYNLTKGFDGALTFDGTDDLVSFGNVLDKNDTDSFSIEGWMYATTTDAGVLVAKRNSRETAADAGYSIARASSGTQIVFRVSDGTTQVTSASGVITSPDGTPDHFVAVCNRSTDVIQLYVNGTLRDTDSIASVNSLSNAVALQLGAANGSSFFGGSLGRVRMYGGALTADNVTYLYTGGVSGTAPTETLDADWKLNDGRGTRVHDSSGNDYIGTFTSAPVWTRVPAKRDGTSSFTGGTPTNPAGAYHNNAETDLDLNPSTTPELANIYREGVTLDGTGDWVIHGNVLNKGTTDNFTIAFWYRTTSTTTSVLFAKRNSRATAADAGYSIDMTNSGTQLVFRVSDGTTAPIVASGTVLQPDGVWHHLTAVLDRTNEAMALYVDGSLLDDTPSASLSGLGSFTNSISLMTGSANTNEPFTGDIANVIMFNKALNATEIAALCSSGTIPASVDLRVPYMGDYLDYSGNNYHGTPAGDPAFTSYTVPTDLSFEESLGEQRNHFKKVVENQHAYALFNGTSSDIDILNPAVVAAGTIVIDFYTNTVAGTDRTLFDVGGTGNTGLVIRSDSAAGFEVEFGTGAGTSTIADTLTVNRWHRAAVRWSGANIEVYIDGVSQGSSASASLTTIGTNDQFIGAVGGSAGFHSGGIRNVWVYTSDKGDSFCTSNGTPHAAITDTTNLTAYYRLEKDAKDYSGKYRDGTPANLTFTDADQETTMLLYGKGLVGDSNLSSANSQTATT